MAMVADRVVMSILDTDVADVTALSMTPGIHHTAVIGVIAG